MTAPARPAFWPPQFGDRWRDSRGDIWQCESTEMLACLSDDTSRPPAIVSADELLKRGPMELVDMGNRVIPEFWPPRHGDTWVDRAGDKWLCESIRGTRPTASGQQYLVCITRQGDDNAEEILRQFGPLTLYMRPGTTRDEVPF